MTSSPFVNTSASPVAPNSSDFQREAFSGERRLEEESAPADAAAAAGVTAGLLLAWQAALQGHQRPMATGASTPAPSQTEATLRAVLDASVALSASAANLQPSAPAAVHAEFRTGPGEHWQLAVQRDTNLQVTLSAAFVPPASGASQLPGLAARLRQRGHAVEKLNWRDESRDQEDGQ